MKAETTEIPLSQVIEEIERREATEEVLKLARLVAAAELEATRLKGKVRNLERQNKVLRSTIALMKAEAAGGAEP